MNDVETIYTQYEDIVSEFTEQVIKNQYASLYGSVLPFWKVLAFPTTPALIRRFSLIR